MDSQTPPDHPSQKLEFCTTPEECEIMVERSDPPPLSPDPSVQESNTRDKLQLPGTWKLTIITLSLALGTFLVALDTMIIGIAVPTITSQFHSLDDIAWYGSVYLMTTTALQPSFGRIYKLYNAKTTYLVCVALFEGTLRRSKARRRALTSGKLDQSSAPRLLNQQCSSSGGQLLAVGLQVSCKALSILLQTMLC
jgi:hypothetical protein